LLARSVLTVGAMRQIEVELCEDLVDSCIPGNVVTISGVVKSINSEIHGGRYGKRAQSNSLYILYLSANAVENSATVLGMAVAECQCKWCRGLTCWWTLRRTRTRTRQLT
jgi:DNA replicative helicase MCM subunit Mcm2 (Cdc46/Mcm family)